MFDIRKVMADALKGYQIVEFSMAGGRIVAHLVDKDGRASTLRFDPEPAAAEPAPEPAAAEPTPLRPTTMAPVGGDGFKSAVERMAANPKLPPEAKGLLRDLSKARRREGDEVAIVRAAQSAAAGDLEPLRELARQVSPPREMHS